MESCQDEANIIEGRTFGRIAEVTAKCWVVYHLESVSTPANYNSHCSPQKQRGGKPLAKCPQFKHHKGEKKSNSTPNKKTLTQNSRRDLSEWNSGIHSTFPWCHWKAKSHLSSTSVSVHKERTGKYNHPAGCTKFMEFVYVLQILPLVQRPARTSDCCVRTVCLSTAQEMWVRVLRNGQWLFQDL